MNYFITCTVLTTNILGYMKRFSILLLLAILIGCGGNNEPAPSNFADLIIKNGTIYTANDSLPKAEAIAVTNGKIVFVGSNEDIKNWIGDSTEVLDLMGKTMTPGFIEGHGHITSLGYARMKLDLNGVNSFQEIVDMVEDAVQEAEPGEWILGRGWHQSKWDSIPAPIVNGFPVHYALSAVSPDNPVWLGHASGHAGFANAKAMEIAGLYPMNSDNRMKTIEGGEILRDMGGNPIGVFNETAQRLIGEHIPDQTPETNLEALELAIEECLKNGITSFQDAGSTREDVEAYKTYLEQGKLRIRLWAMVTSRDLDFMNETLKHSPEVGLGDNYLTIGAIKLHADGALGSRGAWLLEPYTDRPGHVGHETQPMNFVLDVCQRSLEKGYQVCTHAIGDRTNREVLDQYETAFNGNPERTKDHRFRMEHAQHLHPDDIPRFAELGVIASMQGIHMASDRSWAIDRLGEKRIVEGAYVWQKLIQSGAVIVNGTDVPVEPVSPIASFYASVVRKTLKGEPEEGYEPDQRMTRDQALKSYTLNAAYGAFEENIKGSIEVGKLADFTVFSQDIMTIADEEILNTEVIYTIVNGKVEYQK